MEGQIGMFPVRICVKKGHESWQFGPHVNDVSWPHKTSSNVDHYSRTIEQCC